MATDDAYDFACHATLRDRLEGFVGRHGRAALQACDRLERKHVGLENQGATCYLNSLVQALFFCRDFREQVYAWRPAEAKGGAKEDPQASIPLQLQRLFVRMQFAEQAAVSTRELTKSFGWSEADAFEQQDVQELCRVLLDSLEKGPDGKAFTRPFTGSHVDLIVCLRCGHKRAKLEEFQDLSLVVQDTGDVAGALDKHVEQERLEGDNQYFCEHCDAKVDATKGLRLCSLPSVLMLHLKRFVFDWNTERRVKLRESVALPMTVDARDLVGPGPGEERPEMEPQHADPAAGDPAHGGGGGAGDDGLDPEVRKALREAAVTHDHTVYHLGAVLVHSGNANSGHYFAIVRTGAESWHEFNDMQVTAIRHAEMERMCAPGGSLAEGGAYMLVYVKERENAELRDLLGSRVMPRPESMAWIERENAMLSQLRQVAQREAELVRFKVVAGPALCRSTREVLRPGPASVTLEMHCAKASLLDAKHLAYARLVQREFRAGLPLARCRLRRLYEADNMLGDVFPEESDGDEAVTQSLRECGINGHTTLMLEFLRPGQVAFDSCELRGTQLRLYFWDSRVRVAKPASASYWFPEHGSDYRMDRATCWQTSLPPLSLSEDATVEHLEEAVGRTLGVPRDSLVLVRLDELCKYKYKATVEGGARDLVRLPHGSGEPLSDVQLATGDAVVVVCDGEAGFERIEAEHAEAREFVTISFNDPAENRGRARGPVHYDFSIRVSRNLTLEELRARMLESLGEEQDPSGFHLKRSVKSTQLKDLQATCEAAGLIDNSVVHIGRGAPIPKGHIMLRLFRPCGEKKTGEALGRVNVPEGATVTDLTAAVAMHLGFDSAAVQLRDRSPSGAMGAELVEGRPLDQALKRLQDGRSVYALVNNAEEDGAGEDGLAGQNGAGEDGAEEDSLNEVGNAEEKGEKAARSGRRPLLQIKSVRLDVLEGRFVVGLAAGHLVDGGRTLRDLCSSLCPGYAVAHLHSDCSAPQHTWALDASRLDWWDPAAVDTQAAARGAVRLDSKPLQMRDGSVLLYTSAEHIGLQSGIDGLAQHLVPDMQSSSERSDSRGSETSGSAGSNNTRSDSSSYTSGTSSRAAGAGHRPNASSAGGQEGASDDFWAGAADSSGGADMLRVGSFDQVEGWNAGEAVDAAQAPPEQREGRALERVPSLDLSSLPPAERRTSYQDEFMEKEGEFSESWREAAAEMQARGGAAEDAPAPKPEKAKATAESQQTRFEPGERVLAKAPEWKRFFPGTVFSRSEAGDTYAVDFDDGDRQERVPASLMRPELTRPHSRSRLARPSSSSTGLRASDDFSLPSPAADLPSSGAVLGLDSEDLCPVDKKARRKDKLASRDLRLRLMFMDPDSAGAAEMPPLTNVPERAQSSPTRTRPRVQPEPSKQRRVVSSKLVRPKTLAPLPSSMVGRPHSHPIATAAPAASCAGPASRIPRLDALEPSRPRKATPHQPGASFLPSPPSKPAFAHAGRRLVPHEDALGVDRLGPGPAASSKTRLPTLSHA